MRPGFDAFASLATACLAAATRPLRAALVDADLEVAMGAGRALGGISPPAIRAMEECGPPGAELFADLLVVLRRSTE